MIMMKKILTYCCLAGVLIVGASLEAKDLTGAKSTGISESGLSISSDLLRPLPILSSDYLASTDNRSPASLDMSEIKETRKLSLPKAMLLSALLPGAGQYYAGSKFKGQVFMGVEAAIWSGFAAFRVYGNWREDDYKAYAQAHAQVDNEGKDEQFYDWVGFYENRDEFNQFGRLYFPDRAYMPDTRAYYWQWDTEASRVEFKDLKDASKTAFRNSSFMLGMALLNRVISGIDTYRTVKAAGKRVDAFTQFGEYKLKIAPKPLGSDPSITVTLSRKF
jgi:hypothetical protein